MTLDEQLEILQAAKRGEKIERKLYFVENNPWTPIPTAIPHAFDFCNYFYRIADPYAELKAAAKDPTKQIRLQYNKDCDGNGEYSEWMNAGHRWLWGNPPEDYEIRDKPKAKKVVKYRCWFSTFDEQLHWLLHDPNGIGWHRRPAFDKECEVEDD